MKHPCNVLRIFVWEVLPSKLFVLCVCVYVCDTPVTTAIDDGQALSELEGH